MYVYKCRSCGARDEVWMTLEDEKPNPLGPCPDPACTGTLRRSFELAIAPVMQEHYNPSVDGYVSSMREFKDKLKRGSEEYFKRTGIESNFVPADKEALGATDEGLDSTNAQRRKMGLAPVSNLG